MRHKLTRLFSRAAVAVAMVTFLGLSGVAGPGIQGASASGPPAGLGPADLQSAYALPSATQGVGQTVAVVTPYDDSGAEADLTAYRSQTSLPACTSANGCFTKLDLSGGNALATAATAQALDAVSAVCPNCHIALVEAKSTNIADVGVAVDSAVALGAKFVATTVTIKESQVGSAELTYDMHFNHAGVAITAPSGDSGFGVTYPAASPYVVAVGGTQLTKNTSVPRGWDETVWGNSGSGCSTVEPKPVWQAMSPDPGCSNRIVNDISAVATGVAYYKAGNWNVGSGTVISAAIIAAAFALAGTPANDTNPASYLYGNAAGLTDLTSTAGSNGTCAPASWCTAGTGYDGPTGLGTPNGVSAFLASYYQPITPTRFMDTRTGTGGFTGPLGAHSTVELAIAGQHGIPAANVTAVALNLTVTAQSSNGFITAWADGTPRPTANDLDYSPGQNIASLEIVPVGADGIIDFYNASGGTVQLLADVSGYFTSDPTMPGDETYSPLTAPVRILDTRNGTGAPLQPLANGVTLPLQVAGANGIPANATAVAINFTAIQGTAASFLEAWADGTSQPAVSNLQFPTSVALTGSALVQVGSTGMIDIKAGYTTTGSVNVIGDVMGYFTIGTTNETYHPIYPLRTYTSSPIAAGATVTVPIGDPVIAPSPTVVGVLEGSPQGTGRFVAYPSTISLPLITSVTFNGTTNTNNLNFLTTGNGAIDIANASTSANVANIDTQGYFSIG
jgi:hypothetical protein